MFPPAAGAAMPRCVIITPVALPQPERLAAVPAYVGAGAALDLCTPVFEVARAYVTAVEGSAQGQTIRP